MTLRLVAEREGHAIDLGTYPDLAACKAEVHRREVVWDRWEVASHAAEVAGGEAPDLPPDAWPEGHDALAGPVTLDDPDTRLWLLDEDGETWVLCF